MAADQLSTVLALSYDDLAPLSAGWKKEFLLHRRTLGLIRTSVGDITGKRTLDIGCGVGVLPRALVRLGASAEGIDKHILAEWGKSGFEDLWRRIDLKIIVGDFFDAPLPAVSYDLITAEDVFEHLHFTQREFLEKIYALLKPGGWCILTTPNVATLLKRARLLAGKSPYWDLDDFFLRKQPFGHLREFTARELKTMGEKTGFRVPAVKAYNIYWRVRWLRQPRKILQFIFGALSALYPPGRDVLFFIAQKPLS